MHLFSFIQAVVIMVGLSGALAFVTGTRGRIWWATPLLIAILVTPALVATSAFARFVMALLGVLITVRSVELLRDAKPHLPFWRRFIHTLSLFDTRAVRPCPRQFDRARFIHATLASLICGVSYGLCFEVAPKLQPPARHVLQWLSCAAFAISLFEVITTAIVFIALTLGFRLPPLHNRPYLSTSVRIFWTRRWNQMIGQWLRLYIYAPVFRTRTAAFATSVTFLASAVMHAYLLLAAAGWSAGLSAGIYFAIQPVFFFAESKLKVAQWNPAAARVWTALALMLPLPFFSLPLLALVTSQ